MKNWYASVNYGLEKIVSDIVKTYDAQNIKVLDSALTFSCANEINIKCINNLFVVLSAFHSENITEATKKIFRLPFRSPQQNGKTFRVIVMDCGKLRAIPQNIMVEVEKNISRQTKLEVHRANPDIEIWINRRNDGATFFMVRVKKHSPFDKKLKQGELRPDVVDVMLHKARVNKQSIIVDMFGGWGAIAAAVENGRYQKLLIGVSILRNGGGTNMDEVFAGMFSREPDEITSGDYCKPNKQNQEEMTSAYRRAAVTHGAIAVNAGDAWVYAYDKHPDISLYVDGIHANSGGAYLTACVFVSSLFGLHVKDVCEDNTYQSSSNSVRLGQAAWEYASYYGEHKCSPTSAVAVPDGANERIK